MKLIHFMTILLLDPYFKINGWIYRGILGILVKKIIKSNFIPFQSSQFRREWKFEILRLHLGVHKGMEWNEMVIREWKWIEWNGMHLSKGKE